MYIWTIIMTVASICSSLFALLFACFGEPEEDSGIYIFDNTIEVLFIIDMIRTFFSAYTDPKHPEKPVMEL